MNSNEIQTLIGKLERVLSSKTEVLDSIVEEYRRELPTHAERWMTEQVDLAISMHSRLFETFSMEQVQQLKRDVKGLFARLPAIALEATADVTDWPHNRELDQFGYPVEKDEPFFEKSFRAVVSHIATILGHHGLLEGSVGYLKKWQAAGEGTYRYGQNAGLQEMNIVSIPKYKIAFGKWRQTREQLEAARLSLSKARAKELWESA